MSSQYLPVGTIFRYPKPGRADEALIDGLPNFFHFTRDARPGAKAAILESGINSFAPIRTGPDCRRPAILLRSSPAKAGTAWTPWIDTFDVASGEYIYFGDHKPSTKGPLLSTRGNKALWDAWRNYITWDRRTRQLAPPLLVFITVPWRDSGGSQRDKGAVQFRGLAICESMDEISAIDPASGAAYPNLRVNLRILDLADSGDVLDWSWINARKDLAVPIEEADEMAPPAWIEWVNLAG